MTRHSKKLSHARELYYILFILVVVLLGAFSIWGPEGYLHLRKTQRELQEHRELVHKLQATNAEKKRQVQALKSDPRTLEEYARKKGYVKKGELIQHVPDQQRAK